VRTAYQQPSTSTTPAGLVATFNARPERRHAADSPTARAAEADRPYWQAVQEVIDQWADADAQYDAAVAQIDWARTTRQPAPTPTPTRSTSPLPEQTCACDA
jgi:hypothetical protein